MNVAPSVYSKSNVSRVDNEFVYDKYLHLVQWRNDEQDTILDIGSGPGDMIVQVLVPKIPKPFKYIVGSDIDQDMVDYANEVNSSSKVFFEQWDMGGDCKVLLQKYPGGFDHIFSVYALHWHPDQQRVIQNIHDLLSLNGDCLLAILGRHDLYDLYRELSKSQKWGQLMQKQHHVTVPFQYIENRKEIYHEYFISAGFKTCHIEVVPKKTILKNVAGVKNFVSAINPLFKHLTPAQIDEYFEDYIAALHKLGMAGKSENGEDDAFTYNFEFLIVHAQK